MANSVEKLSDEELLGQLQGKSASVKSLSDEELLNALGEGKLSGVGKAGFAIRSALEGRYFGALEPVISGVKATAGMLSGKSFKEGYAEDVAQRKAEKAANPILDVASQVTGAAIPGPENVALQGLRGANLLARGVGLGGRALLPTLARGAFTGAVTAGGGEAVRQATQRPTGFIEGGNAVSEVARSTALGATLGAIAEKASQVLGSTAMSRRAETQAFRATGAKLKDTQKAIGKGNLEKMGRLLLDEEIVTPTTTPGKIAENLEGALEHYGQSIGQSIEMADQVISDKAVNLRDVINKVTKSIDLDQMKKTPGLEGTAQKIEGYFETLIGNGETVGPMKAWNIKRGIDKALSTAYKNKAFSEFPEAESALLKIRSELQNNINGLVDDMAKAIGFPQSPIRSDLAKYSLLAEANRIATKESARAIANRMVSLTDYIAGAGGLAAGATQFLQGGADIPSVAKTAGAALAVGALNKAGRTFGPPMMATGANAISRLPTQKIIRSGRVGAPYLWQIQGTDRRK